MVPFLYVKSVSLIWDLFGSMVTGMYLEPSSVAAGLVYPMPVTCL